jgi:hypothetical protein
VYLVPYWEGRAALKGLPLHLQNYTNWIRLGLESLTI